jgi:hypothetical protein
VIADLTASPYVDDRSLEHAGAWSGVRRTVRLRDTARGGRASVQTEPLLLRAALGRAHTLHSAQLRGDHPRVPVYEARESGGEQTTGDTLRRVHHCACIGAAHELQLAVDPGVPAVSTHITIGMEAVRCM